MSTLIPWGVAYTFYVPLLDQLTGQHRDNPTLATGDFMYSKDGGTLTNLGTTPSVAPASSRQVQVTISATEAECSTLVIYARDASGAQWDDDGWRFHTVLADGGLAGKITSGTPTTTSFISSQLVAANTDHYKDIWIKFVTGGCAKAICRVSAFNAGTDTVTVSALPTAPAVGDVWEAMF